MLYTSSSLSIARDRPGRNSCGQAVTFLGGGDMHDPELYRKYRQLIEGLADERRSTELSLTTLHALLQQFESEAGALEPAAAGFVSDEIADCGRQGLRRHVIRRGENLTQSVRGDRGRRNDHACEERVKSRFCKGAPLARTSTANRTGSKARQIATVSA
jgi:hypothetical protein